MIIKDFDDQNVINGTHGYAQIDGEYFFESTGGKAGYKTDREDIQFCQEMEKGTKLMGISGEWELKGKMVHNKRTKNIAESFAQGKDPRSIITMNLADPDALGHLSVTLFNCWFNDPTILDFEAGKTVEQNFSGGFKGMKYNDYIV